MSFKKNNSRVDFFQNQQLLIELLLIIVIVVYSNSLSGSFIFDDCLKIAENPDIRNLANLTQKLVYRYNQNYQNFASNDPSRPLTYFTFTLNYALGKLNTFGYHLFNLILHILNTCLIFFLTKKIIFYSWKKDALFFSFWVALLFSIHPVNVDAVTYVFGRSGELAAFFYFSSLMLFIKACEGKKIVYSLSLSCFVLGIFSKQTVLTLPALLLVFDYIFLSDFKISKVSLKKYYHLPFWIIMLSYLLFRYFYIGSIGEIDAYSGLSSYSYFLTQLYVITRYFKLLILPLGLAVYHAPEQVLSILEFRILFSLGVILLLIFTVYKIAIRKTPTAKLVLFSCLWFFITLTPSSSFFPIPMVMAERRLYLPGYGFYLVLVLTGILAFNYLAKLKAKKFSYFFKVILGIYLIFLSYTTLQRNRVYGNPLLLWQDAVLKYPRNYVAHTKLGLAYEEQEKDEKAMDEYQVALHLKPDYAQARNSLGCLYKKQGQYDKAQGEFMLALVVNHNLPVVHNNLGLLYKEQKEYDKATYAFKEALKLDPNLAIVHNNLGEVYNEQQKYAKALSEFKLALKLNPDLASTYYNLAQVYYAQKKYKKCLKSLNTFLELNPYAEHVREEIKKVKELIAD